MGFSPTQPADASREPLDILVRRHRRTKPECPKHSGFLIKAPIQASFGEVSSTPQPSAREKCKKPQLVAKSPLFSPTATQPVVVLLLAPFHPRSATSSGRRPASGACHAKLHKSRHSETFTLNLACSSISLTISSEARTLISCSSASRRNFNRTSKGNRP